MAEINVIPTTREGALLAKLRAMFKADAQLQEGEIRVEKVLTAANVAQRFNLNGQDTARRPLEVFIGQNDLIIPYAMKVAINKVLDVAVGNNGNCDDLTYPDKSVFTTAATATAVSEADALKAIWAGNYTLKSNTTEIQNFYQLRKNYQSNQTQGSATTQPQLSDLGFVPLWQTAILSGQNTNILEFTPAPGADLQQIGGTAPSQNILVLHMLCFVVRNGAQTASWTQLAELFKGGKLLY